MARLEGVPALMQLAMKGNSMAIRMMDGALWGRFALLFLGAIFTICLANGADSIASAARVKETKHPVSGPGKYKLAPPKKRSGSETTSTPVRKPCPCRDKAPVPTPEYIHCVEAEITLDQKHTLARLRSLPRVPGSRLNVLEEDGRLRAQWPATVVADLMEQGAEVTVLKDFMLAQKVSDKSQIARSQLAPMAVCSGDYVMGDNDTDYSIPEFDWVYSDIEIGGAPLTARVTCIDIHYEIVHPYISDLAVDLCDYNLCIEYRLWDHEGGSGDSINETVTGITDFAGAPVNQVWGLWATDYAEQDTGYIDSWWIKVYYATPAAPGNDLCSSAALVQDGVPYQGSTVGATGDFETRCSYYCDRFDATRTGLVTLSVDSSDFDPTAAVFEQCGGEELACNDDALGERNSEITLRMTAGASCYIRVAGCFWGSGGYTLTVQQSLVLYYASIDGYRLLSFVLASAVVNCQLTFAWAASRRFSQAAVCSRSFSMLSMRCERHWRPRMPNSISAISSQLPCLGV